MRKIKSKLTIFFIAIALLPLTINLTITYFQRLKTIENHVIDKLVAVRDLKVQQLNGWLNDRVSSIKALSTDKEIRSLDFFKDINDNDFENSLDHIKLNILNHSEYNSISIANPKTGIIKISTDENHIGVNILRKNYFLTALKTKKLHIEDVFQSKQSGKPEMIIAVPIWNLSNNEISGVLLANVELHNSLYKLLLNRTGLGKTGETLIVNKNTVAINELRWYDDAPLKLQIEAEPAVNASQGITGFGKSIDYRGEGILTAYTHIPLVGWGFVAKQDLSELNKPIRDMLYNFIVLFLGSLILVLFVAFALSNNLAKPILEMVNQTQKIKQGDFSVRCKAKTKDEYATLANSMNSMAATIESRINIQNGVSELIKKTISANNISDFSVLLIKNITKITNSNFGAFYLLNRQEQQFEHSYSIGINKELLKPFKADSLEGEFGKVLIEKNIIHIKNIPSDTLYTYKTFLGSIIPKEVISIPLVVNNEVSSIITLGSINNYDKASIQILQQSHININTVYINLLTTHKSLQLSGELKINNVQLQNQTQEMKIQSEELLIQNTELELQKTQVEGANKLKSEFLSNMSHELRTPLNSIIALTKVVLMESRSKLSKEENKYLEIVLRNSKELLYLINDILDISKIEAGEIKLKIKSVSLPIILKAIEEKFIHNLKKKEITLDIQIQDNIPYLLSDEDKILHILQNVIGNAIKFTIKGGVNVDISMIKKEIFIKVSDTGIGIPENSLSSIFQEFKQVDGSTSREYEGTGLGLSIAYETAKILGGSISVKSKLGIGSVFTIILPLSINKEKSLEPVKFEMPDIIKSEYKPENIQLLIVEDNLDAITQLLYILKNEKFNVNVAKGGQQAVDFVDQTIPDGIILDLLMPEKDGFDVLKYIRSNKKTIDIPILILTAKDLTEEDVEKLSDGHVQQLLFKGNIEKDEFLYQIKTMLGYNGDFEVVPLKKDLVKVTISGDKPTILIIEDNKDNITTLKAVLRNDYYIVEAHNGEKGLEIANEQTIDLILLDIGLPKMDGFEVAAKLKASDRTKKIPIIALTAHAMKKDKQATLDAGCDDYISKPIDPVEILNKISDWWE